MAERRFPFLPCLLALACSWPVGAQPTVNRGYARVTAGFAKLYLDEPSQFIAGGSVRVNLLKRLGVEPEFLASRGSRFNQWCVMPNVVFDLSDPNKKVGGYVIGGVGYIHDLDKSIRYEHGELAWNGGLGVRVFISRNVFLSPEFRLGAAMSRAVVSVGYRF